MIVLYVGLGLFLGAIVVFSVLLVSVSQARRASKKPNCHYCGSTALHVSSPKGPIDDLLTYWNCLPYRCEVCFRRQYRLTAGSDTR